MKVGDLVKLRNKQYSIFENKKENDIGLVCYTGSDRKGHYISVYYASLEVWRWHTVNELKIIQRVDML